MADATEITGVLASVFTGISLIPQLYSILKTKKPATTPTLTLVSLFIGLSLWVIYGSFKEDWIIIISNGFSLLVNIIIGILSFYFYTRNKQLAQVLSGKI